MTKEVGYSLDKCIEQREQLRELNAELLEALKLCVDMIPAMDVPVCADEAITKAEALK
jgi:hypothetical protein